VTVQLWAVSDHAAPTGRAGPAQVAFGLVVTLLGILQTMAILANLGGFRDRLVRRIVTRGSMFVPGSGAAPTPERTKSTARLLIVGSAMMLPVLILATATFLANLF
jgi:hypothetical protein